MRFVPQQYKHKYNLATDAGGVPQCMYRYTNANAELEINLVAGAESVPQQYKYKYIHKNNLAADTDSVNT